MEFERFILFAVIMLVALIAILIGIVVALRGRRVSKEESPIDSKPAPEWVKNLAGAAGKTLMRTDSLTPNAPADALVVARDPVSNEWAIEFNGTRYNSLKDIHDNQAARKVLEALSNVQRFAGAIPITTVAPTPAPSPAMIEPSAPPAVKPVLPVGPPLEPVVAAVLSQGDKTPSRPKYPAPPNSILDQIEKVLQRNLLREPALANRKIHMGAAPDGSLLIEVDWNTYKSADEVPEADVRNLIKASIQEWERTA
jgi:hypothetical protein